MNLTIREGSYTQDQLARIRQAAILHDAAMHISRSPLNVDTRTWTEKKNSSSNGNNSSLTF